MNGLKHQPGWQIAGGVYIFAIRRRGRGTANPWYVGLNKGRVRGSLSSEALTRDKLHKYARALASDGSGSALLFFLSPGDRRSDDIPRLETFLIWLARQRNPRLLNTKKIRLTPQALGIHLREHRIPGALTPAVGRPARRASDFRKMIGWTRHMHVGPLRG